MALRKALDQISFLYQEMAESAGALRLCRTMADARLARENGEVGVMLAFEGADPLMNDIHLLRIFYELGVRGVGITWSRRNAAADGAGVRNDAPFSGGGLTAFGVSLVQAAEKLGMFIDVSHLNDAGFWDVMNIAETPVIASHSNCRALVATLRNLADDQLEAIATWLYIEMLEAGYTSVCEFHYVHHDLDGQPFADDATLSMCLLRAAQTAGIGLTLLPVLYQTAGFGAAPPTEGQRRFIRRTPALCC